MIAIARTGLFLALCLMTLAANARTASEVFEIAAKSTVVVLAYDSKGEIGALGSGVVLSGGIVATNCHVIKDAARLAVRHHKQEYPAATRHTDWDRDTCSLTAAGLKAPPATVGSTRGLKVGARVYAIGAPQGLELSLSEGLVSSLREVEGGQYIQTTAPISPGSSGGGLFDEEGRLLGLTTFYLADGQNLNFAVPVEWIGELPKRHAAGTKAEATFVDWLNRALALQDSGNWQEALLHARRWTEVMPDNAPAWLYLGYAYAKLGQNNQAIDVFRQALRIDPEFALAWNNLGHTYNEMGQHSQAINALRQALRIDPDLALAWYNLGHIYNEMGQNSQAIDALRQALRIDPELALTWDSLGYTYNKLGQYSQAIDALRQALRVDPERALTWYNLGYVYRMSGQTDKVTEIHRRLQQLDPEMADRFFNNVVLL